MRHRLAVSHLSGCGAEEKGERGRESELKRGCMTFPALHTQISGKFLQFAGRCRAGPANTGSREERAEADASHGRCDGRSRREYLGMWVRGLRVDRGDL